MSPDAPDDYDWTLCPGAFEVERQRREKSNVMVKERLHNTNRASCVSSGNSLWPRVASGHMCVYDPVSEDDQVEEGDIVFLRRRELQQTGPLSFLRTPSSDEEALWGYILVFHREHPWLLQRPLPNWNHLWQVDMERTQV